MQFRDHQARNFIFSNQEFLHSARDLVIQNGRHAACRKSAVVYYRCRKLVPAKGSLCTVKPNRKAWVQLSPLYCKLLDVQFKVNNDHRFSTSRRWRHHFVFNMQDSLEGISQEWAGLCGLCFHHWCELFCFEAIFQPLKLNSYIYYGGYYTNWLSDFYRYIRL